ncbi:MAG: NUDIX hydrolase [Pyrinomonadaceae bacterium]
MNKPDSWKIENSEVLNDSKIFKLVKNTSKNLATGKESNFFVIQTPNWVNVIPTTKSDEVILIEQFRHGSGKIELEIPGGMIDLGESPENAAIRELKEETGFECEELVPIGFSLPNPAIQDNRTFHFWAKNCRKTSKTNFDENESIVLRTVPIDEIPELVRNAKITHAIVLAAFYNFSVRIDTKSKS